MPARSKLSRCESRAEGPLYESLGWSAARSPRKSARTNILYTKKTPGPTTTPGPYFVLQGFHKGKKFSQRIPASLASQVQQHVDNFKRFQDLADQCITLTDQITQLAQGAADTKKSSRRRRSKPGASRKPMRS